MPDGGNEAMRVTIINFNSGQQLQARFAFSRFWPLKPSRFYKRDQASFLHHEMSRRGVLEEVFCLPYVTMSGTIALIFNTKKGVA